MDRRIRLTLNCGTDKQTDAVTQSHTDWITGTLYRLTNSLRYTKTKAWGIDMHTDRQSALLH